MKTKVNDLCHCGSGKKYKKCCLRKDEGYEIIPLTHESKPQPKYEPTSEGSIGHIMGHYRATTELYLPYNFLDFECGINKFHIEIQNMRFATLSIQFKIKGDQKYIDSLYEGEAWKERPTVNFKQELEPDNIIQEPIAPIFILMLNKHLRVSSVKLQVEDHPDTSLFDQTPDIIILPNSYPPLHNLPTNEYYRYFDKKSTVIYGPLELNKKYDLKIQLESVMATFELAPLFPFGKVVYDQNSVKAADEGGFITTFSFMDGFKPKTIQKYPKWLEYKLDRKSDFRQPPNITPAYPFRGTFPLVDIFSDLGINFDHFKTADASNFIEPLEGLEGKPFTNFETFRLVTETIIPPEKNFDILAKVIKRPLPLRIYEQLQSLPGYNDVLVEVDVLNLSHEELHLKILTEIQGLTDPAIENVTIKGLNNSEKKPARSVVKQTPLLKYGVLETIVNPQRATLYCKVTNLDTGKDIFEQSSKIDLLPHDQMVFSIKDVDNSRTYNLVDFIGAWIHPNDSKGLLDQVRAGAIKYHPQKIFGFPLKTLGDVNDHVKALWEYLSKDLNLHYLNQPFTTKNLTASQRVLLPERVLENKAGNCIDLSVLFASLLEGIGVYTTLFLTEDHAFVGWGNYNKPNSMVFLETTLIATATYEEAQLSAKETFKSNFLLQGMSVPMPDFMATIHGRHIIDLAKVRKSGIVSRAPKSTPNG